MSNKIMALKSNLLSMKTSPTLAINQLIQQRGDSSVPICHLGFGESAFPPPPLLQSALSEHVMKNEYLPVRGLPELREQISAFQNKHFEQAYRPEDIFIGPGSKELLFDILYCMKGTLLLPAPCWVSYVPQATLLEKPVALIPTSVDSNYCINPDAFEKVCIENQNTPKCLILTNPNNPTSHVYSHDNLKAIAEVCRRYEVLVISDEIYSLIYYGDSVYRSFACYYPERTIVTSGLSKAFCAGGYRLGYACVPNELVDLKTAIESVASETFSAVCAPVQYAAAQMYDRFDEVKPYLDATCAIHQKVNHYCYERLLQAGARCPKPSGGFYCYPSFKEQTDILRGKGIQTSVALAEYLLKQSGVATLAGSEFNQPDQDLCLRLAVVDYDGPALVNKVLCSGIESLTPEQDFAKIVMACDAIDRLLSE